MSIPLQKRKLLPIFLLLAAIFYGAVLRLYHLGVQSYWMDEGYTALAVKILRETGSSILPSGVQYHCALFCYPTTLLTYIFGENAFSLRLLAAVAGIVLIPVIYLLAKKMFNKHVALLSAFFISFSYWQIAWSRQARWYTLLTLFFWLSLYFFYSALYDRSHRQKKALLSAFFTLLAISTHPLGLLLPVIELVWLTIDRNILIILKNKFLNLATPHKTAVLLLSVAIFIWLSVKAMSLLSVISLSYALPYYLSFYARHYWLFIVFLVIAIYVRPKHNIGATGLLLLSVLVYLIPLAFFTDTIQYRYLFHITPALFILGAAGIVYAVNALKKTVLKISLVGFVLFLFFFSYLTPPEGILQPQTLYFLESDNISSLPNRPYYSYTPQPNWTEAYAFVKTNMQKGAIVVSSHPHFTYLFLDEAGYWLPIDYLGNNPNRQAIPVLPTDRYVGAQTIPDLATLRSLAEAGNGYIIFDYQAWNGRVPANTLAYIEQELSLVFYEETNSYSKIWVYSF